MTRAEILYTAKRCVCGDREQDYGSPENNFQRIAEFWAIYLRDKCVDAGADVCILPEDVAAMLSLLKIARIASGHGKTDNWVDLAGYAACGGEIESGATTNTPVEEKPASDVDSVLDRLVLFMLQLQRDAMETRKPDLITAVSITTEAVIDKINELAEEVGAND